MPDLDLGGLRRRAVVLVLFLVGFVVFVASCGEGDNAANTAPLPQATDVDLGGVDVEMHHAVG